MRAVDLFCGCGGLSLGFLKAGIEIVSAFDNWDDALNVYRTNFNHPAIKCDLSNEDASVEQIIPFHPDMIIGGPPCQDFSSAGKRDENNGRGDLTVSYANIIARVHPTWFVMENVSRIVKTQKLVDALAIFRAAGYGITYTILNAALCGVPQKRKRFVMIGKLGEQDNFILNVLEAGLADKEMSVADCFGDLLEIKNYYRHPRSYVRRGIFSVDEPSPTIRGVNRPMPKGYKLHPNDPVDSLEGVRSLTTRERSMIQTFPENFCFLGNKTNQEQMIGNAVPCNLGLFVGHAIMQFAGEPVVDISSQHRIIHNDIEKTEGYFKEEKKPRIKQLNFLALFDQYQDGSIVENHMLHEEFMTEYIASSCKSIIDITKNVLISLVKKDNFEQYLNRSAKIYYTGSRFPSTVALNKLFYFMPYIKGKGIRDLYLIKIARLGCRKEGQPGEDKNDFRLVFEIEYVDQLFDDYRPIELEFWHTFTDTTMERLLPLGTLEAIKTDIVEPI